MATDIAVAKAAHDAGFSVASMPVAVSIALAESGGAETKATATGRGLWNIAPSDVGADWADPLANAKAAKAIVGAKGWDYWPSFRTKKYLLFLPRGAAASAAVSALTAPATIVDQIPNPLAPVQALAGEVLKPIRIISDRDLWIRAGIAIAGALIITFAGIALLWSLFGKSAVTGAVKAIT